MKDVPPIKLESILLIDDDETSNYINQRIISKFCLAENTFLASNGLKAIEFLESHWQEKGKHPDFIFLDINMPVMDGFQLLDELDKKKMDYKQGTRVIILTSSSNPKDVAQAKDYAIHAYVNKPLTMDKMKLLVADI